jgi:hypothetical protein
MGRTTADAPLDPDLCMARDQGQCDARDSFPPRFVPTCAAATFGRAIGADCGRTDLIRRGSFEYPVACYEAGPTGYETHRLLGTLGVPCDVVAPTMIPVGLVHG